MTTAARIRTVFTALALVALGAVSAALTLRWGEAARPVAAVRAQEQRTETVELDPALPEPAIRLEVVPDPEYGWNAVVAAEEFALLPDAQDEGVAGGYAYLSVDGAAPVRLYAPWMHLPDLQDGPHTLEITLRDREFRLYARDGEPLRETYSATFDGGATVMADSR